MKLPQRVLPTREFTGFGIKRLAVDDKITKQKIFRNAMEILEAYFLT